MDLFAAVIVFLMCMSIIKNGREPRVQMARKNRRT